MPLAAYADTPRVIRLFPSRSLQRVLARHAAECAALGLRLDAVADEDDAAVHSWLRSRANLLPLGLADDLERIEDLTDERGSSALLDAAHRAGTNLRGLGLDPLEMAVRAFLDHRSIFEAAHGRHILETLRGTTEFTGRAAGSAVPFLPSRMHAMEIELGKQFDARARSAHCRVTPGRDGDRQVFTIAHGAMVRSDEALDERPMLVCEAPGPVYLADRAVRYRPQRRDIVVYEAGAGRLRIRAGDAPTMRAYRRAFGELLFGDAEWFGNDAIVSLEPLLRLGRGVEVPTPGIREVRLVGLLLNHVEDAGVMALTADEMWRYLERRVVNGLKDAELLEATFRVFPPGSSSAANVKVRVPNRVEYTRIPDDVIRPFLERRGFLARADGAAQ